MCRHGGGRGGRAPGGGARAQYARGDGRAAADAGSDGRAGGRRARRAGRGGGEARRREAHEVHALGLNRQTKRRSTDLLRRADVRRHTRTFDNATNASYEHNS